MRRTVITITSLFIFLTSAVYAVNPSQNVILQGAFEGQNIENLEEAEAIFLKGYDAKRCPKRRSSRDSFLEHR